MCKNDVESISVRDALAAEQRWFQEAERNKPPRSHLGPIGAAVGIASSTEDSQLAALCLSGGGIRSATFSLGVLQGLAERGLLGRFHYLSSVSGGGYIASWLSSWIMRVGLDEVVRTLAKPMTANGQPQPIQRLRAYANYLSPVWGLSADFLALAAIFLRNLAVHWCVVLPLLAGALLLPRLQLAILGKVFFTSDPAAVSLVAAVLLLVWTIAYFAADLPGDPAPRKAEPISCVARFLLKPRFFRSTTKRKVDPTNRFAVFCFLPLLLSAMLFTVGLRWWGGPPLSLPRSMLFIAGLHFLGAALGIVWRGQRGLDPRPRKSKRLNWALDLLYVGVSGAVGGLLFYGVGVVSAQWGTTEGLQRLTVFCVPALLVAFWAGVTCYAAMASRITTEEDREWWARSAGWWLGAGVAWLAASAMVIYLPRWVLQTWLLQTEPGPPAAGLVATLVGALTGAAGYWSKNGATVAAKAKTVMQAVRMRMLDAAALLSILTLALALSYAVSCTLRVSIALLSTEVVKRQNDPIAMSKYTADEKLRNDPIKVVTQAPIAARSLASYETVLEASTPEPLLLVLATLVAFGSLSSWLIGINAFSLHSMYGNRLARAYLGASNSVRRPHPFTGFDPLDNPRLADLLYVGDSKKKTPRKERRLFPVVNIALNLVHASNHRLDWQQRKAASFTMTPLHCGSAALGFAPTRIYGGDQDGMSLGRAMAISGAAASPNMGYHSSKLVSFVMTFFNVRLGWWMPNPAAHSRSVWSNREPSIGLEALYAEAIAGATDKRRFVHLSDGGHFENLGLYEMVRRQCRLIVAVDATSDPHYKYSDLQSAIQKIRIDFGIPIQFLESLPSSTSAMETGRCIAVATINYGAADEGAGMGTLIYVKPALSADVPLDVRSYAAAHEKTGGAFPHQATSDQFFDEAQFESYRMLGQHIVRKSFPADGSWPVAPTSEGPVAAREAKTQSNAAETLKEC